MTRIEHLNMIADEYISSSQAPIDSFQKAFNADPLYALSWGDSVMNAAAQRQVGNILKTYIKNVVKKNTGMSDQQMCDLIVEELSSEVMRGARNFERSTSQLSNCASLWKNSWMAALISRINGKF